MISNLPIVTKFIGSIFFGKTGSVLYFGMESINLPTVLTFLVKTVGKFIFYFTWITRK
jgi:hypothetical protein